MDTYEEALEAMRLMILETLNRLHRSLPPRSGPHRTRLLNEIRVQELLMRCVEGEQVSVAGQRVGGAK